MRNNSRAKSDARPVRTHEPRLEHDAASWTTANDALQSLRMSVDALDQRVREIQRTLAPPEKMIPYDHDYLMTLRQGAGLVFRDKRCLEHYKYKTGAKKLPEPEVLGKGGRASYWRASVLLPWLERVFGQKVPDISQVVRDI